MNDNDRDIRRQRFLDSGFAYDEKAIEFANSGLRALTYLNGGAVVAIPAAVALFKTDPAQVKMPLIASAVFFVIGLVLVVLAQAAAYFTMALRAESQRHSAWKQANDSRAKNRASDRWRRWGIWLFFGSLVVFIAGCGTATYAVLTAYPPTPPLAGPPPTPLLAGPG